MEINNAMFHRPDWVILGAPTGDGKYCVIGSTQMLRAEFEAEFEEVFNFTGRIAFTPIKRIEMRAELMGYKIAVGDTYAEALSKLLGEWTPAEAQRAGLPFPTPQLTQGETQ